MPSTCNLFEYFVLPWTVVSPYPETRATMQAYDTSLSPVSRRSAAQKARYAS